MEDIHAIKPLLNPSIWDTHIPLVVLLVALFTFGYGIIKINQMYKNKVTVTPSRVEPVETPIEILTRVLRELESKRDLILAMDLHNLYLQLTKINKDCVSDIYQVPINNMTTKEMLSITELPSAVKDNMIEFLHTIDRLKFSPIHTDQQKAEEMYLAAQQVLETIRNTIIANDDTKLIPTS